MKLIALIMPEQDDKPCLTQERSFAFVAALVSNRLIALCSLHYSDGAGAHKSDFQFEQFDAIAELPLFNPDLEGQPPVAVQTLHAAIAWSDLIVIASPEYAHGVTGVIKNALETFSVPYKPVLMLQARARSNSQMPLCMRP